MNRKHVPIDGNMAHQKALNPYEDFSKRSPGISDSKPFIYFKKRMANTDSGVM